MFNSAIDIPGGVTSSGVLGSLVLENGLYKPNATAGRLGGDLIEETVLSTKGNNVIWELTDFGDNFEVDMQFGFNRFIVNLSAASSFRVLDKHGGNNARFDCAFDQSDGLMFLDRWGMERTGQGLMYANLEVGSQLTSISQNGVKMDVGSFAGRRTDYQLNLEHANATYWLYNQATGSAMFRAGQNEYRFQCLTTGDFVEATFAFAGNVPSLRFQNASGGVDYRVFLPDSGVFEMAGKVRVGNGSQVFIGLPEVAPANADIRNNEMAPWLDDVADEIKLKYKDSSGNVGTKTIA